MLKAKDLDIDGTHCATLKAYILGSELISSFKIDFFWVIPLSVTHVLRADAGMILIVSEPWACWVNSKKPCH